MPSEDGTLDAYVTIPANTPVGVHEIVLTGWDANGKEITKTTTIVIKAQTPLWVWVAGILSVLTLIGVLVVVVIDRRRPVRS